MVPVTPPSKRPDRHYDFGRMNLVFALSAVALLVMTVAMVVGDYGKPWKRLQAEFRDLERQKVATELEEERRQLSDEQIRAVQEEIAAERERLAGRREEIRRQESELSRLEGKIYETDAASRISKSLLDTARYRYELALREADEQRQEKARQEVEGLRARWVEEVKALEEYQQGEAQVSRDLSAARSALVASQKKLESLLGSLASLEQRLARLKKGLDYFLLNLPLMDVFQPTLKVEQVILPGLYHDLNFTTVDRVDRCVTCHVAANRHGFDGEEWREPFRSHPRLDLFLSDSSPHPYNRFGCTVCHGGLDRATDFARAGHSPVSAEQRERWIDQWDWQPQKYLETPILPAHLSEAGCVSCHAGEIWTPQTELQDVGREMVYRLGCSGCHAIEHPAFTELRRPGPDLTRIASKTNAPWVYKWIEAPRDFHPTTWMPHFFYQENVQGETNLQRQAVEIDAVVAYLWDRSEQLEYAAAPAGDAEDGQQLFETVGCSGCHIRDAEATRDQFFPEINRLHGPNLIRTGSKVSSGWLYAWLKNPEQYWADTNMPNLRLSDTEAADLVAYLMSSRDPAYENLELPAVAPEIREELVVDYLRSALTLEQSEARMRQMSLQEQRVYLGERTIRKYGCFSCHDIAGFEDAKPIGVELSEEGSKPLHLFDFGHVDEVPHTRHDWIKTKLLRPRIWDRGKELVKEYGELYKMPNFGLSEREADAVLANILGLTKESVRAFRKVPQDGRTAALAAGRKLISRYNCQGCHLIEEKGHAIRATIADVGNLPPNLAAEGARVQSDWLFGYLHDPGQVRLRPWLTVRMPTFGFSDPEANTLVAYFAARDERTPFLSQPGPSEPRDLAVGQTVFGLLQCARCHPTGPQTAAGIAGGPGDLAPSLLLAQERLRHDWVPEWIKDPQGWIPGTRMPTNFPQVEPGVFQSPLVGAIDLPMYAEQKTRMLRYFSSDEELRAYLGDVDKVSRALRDHIWTLR